MKWITDYLHIIATTLVVIFTLLTAVHAVINKKDSRAAVGWVAVILLSPILGAFFYYVIGINRLRRKVNKYYKERVEGGPLDLSSEQNFMQLIDRDKWRPLSQIGNNLEFSPLCYNSKIKVLNTGDEAFPEMLKAIAEAQKTVTLFSYIFSTDEIGMMFLDELDKAQKRGVEVRLQYDSVGSFNSRNVIRREAKKRNLPASSFLPVLLKSRFSNLRNHRKILIADGKIAFTGGLNISQDYWPQKAGKKAIYDLHFKIEGEVVKHLQRAFAEDWSFMTNEILKGDIWFPNQLPNYSEQKNISRVICGGPTATEERIRWHFMSAIATAERSIKIQTPYFLPDKAIAETLCLAALRGVDVDILIPEVGDHAYMRWALQGIADDILAKGCRLWLLPPPFDHSKLLVIDDEYVSLGSANWDTRSFRLNFEMNVEVYDKVLAQELAKLYKGKLEKSYQYTYKDNINRSLPVKFRDGVARLFEPYL